MEDGEWRMAIVSKIYPQSSILYPLSSLQSSPVYKVDKLPAAPDPLNSHAVAVVIKRRVGELRRSDPEFALFHEPFGHDPFQLRPEIVFIPVLKHAVPLAIFRRRLAKDISEIFR